MTLEVFNEPWHYFGARGEGEGGEGSGGRGDEAEEEGVKEGMRREGDAARFREQQGRRLPADVTLPLTPRRSPIPLTHTSTHTRMHTRRLSCDALLSPIAPLPHPCRRCVMKLYGKVVTQIYLLYTQAAV